MFSPLDYCSYIGKVFSHLWSRHRCCALCTVRCGPCKLIYPQLVTLSAELAPAAQIVKFNCNQANKELGKALGIKVAPTFHIYKVSGVAANTEDGGGLLTGTTLSQVYSSSACPHAVVPHLFTYKDMGYNCISAMLLTS